MINDKDVTNVLVNDGVKDIYLDKKYENLNFLSFSSISERIRT